MSNLSKLSHLPFIPDLHPCLKTARTGDVIVILYNREAEVEGMVFGWVEFDDATNRYKTILIDVGDRNIKFYPKYDQIISLKRKKR